MLSERRTTLRENRRSSVLATLKEQRPVTISAIAEQLDVTVHTIYRDLDFLRDMGHRIDTCPGVGGGVRIRP